MQLKKGAVILFQGDSITDCGRSRENDAELGAGYARIVAGLLGVENPEWNLKFLNRGISGHRTADLVNRWTEDCTALKPDFLSILIGVNDVWRRYDANDPTTAEAYYENYKTLLSRARTELGDIPILLLEPFLLPEPVDKQTYRDDLDPKIQMTRRLSREFQTYYLALDGLFAEQSARTKPAFWSADGVHPTWEGHALIARAWIRKFKEI
jgi:lysophospholipase L1-like esterase